jgi:uncharacterized membrane protein
MADYQASTQLSAPAQHAFDYLSDVNNLPAYFDRMTSARPGDGETVQTTAKIPDGTEVAGEAWFRVDTAAKALSWGSEGPNDYHGHLEVTGDGDGSTVTVTLSTVRVETDQIQQGLEQTLANIRRLTESG